MYWDCIIWRGQTKNVWSVIANGNQPTNGVPGAGNMLLVRYCSLRYVVGHCRRQYVSQRRQSQSLMMALVRSDFFFPRTTATVTYTSGSVEFSGSIPFINHTGAEGEYYCWRANKGSCGHENISFSFGIATLAAALSYS